MSAPTEAEIRSFVAQEVARQLVPALREALAGSRQVEDLTGLDAQIRAGAVEVVGFGPIRLLPDTIEDALAELNEKARRELRDESPQPVGCPPAGVWLRLLNVDRDGRAEPPKGPWHMSTGWHGRWGRLTSRCGHPRNMWPDARYGATTRLLTSRDLPGDRVCRKCIALLARDLDVSAG